MGATEALIVSGLFIIFSLTCASIIHAWIWFSIEKDLPDLAAIAPILLSLWLVLAWVFIQ